MSAPARPTTVHYAELVAPKVSGGRLRAYCPVHGGDNQRSLSIEREGEHAGYGYCHTCQARVFVPEMNPEAAARQERWRDRPYQPRRLTGRDLIQSTPKPKPSAESSQEWQRRERAGLEKLRDRMRARLDDPRALAYLAERKIPRELAEAAGVGYIPADARLAGTDLAAKWRDRIVFPLGSPAGLGFIGRSLHLWEPGTDEAAHKALLDAKDRAPEDAKEWGRRWEKSYPAGWYGWEQLAADGARVAVFVEGAFDALALQASRFVHVPVVALAGTAAEVDWIPATIAGVVLALDWDRPEARAAAQKLRSDLEDSGLVVVPCEPPGDGRGKDWSERYRLAGREGVAPVVDALDTLLDELERIETAREPEPAASTMPSAPAEVTAANIEPEHTDPVDALQAEALADSDVQALLAEGWTLAEVLPADEGEPEPMPVLDVLAELDPFRDRPPAERHTCGRALWAHRRDGHGWACIACERSLVLAG